MHKEKPSLVQVILYFNNLLLNSQQSFLGSSHYQEVLCQTRSYKSASLIDLYQSDLSVWLANYDKTMKSKCIKVSQN